MKRRGRRVAGGDVGAVVPGDTGDLGAVVVDPCGIGRLVAGAGGLGVLTDGDL